jgi:hypothetical protein
MALYGLQDSRQSNKALLLQANWYSKVKESARSRWSNHLHNVSSTRRGNGNTVLHLLHITGSSSWFLSLFIIFFHPISGFPSRALSLPNMRNQDCAGDNHLNAHVMILYLLHFQYNHLQPLRHHQNQIFL